MSYRTVRLPLVGVTLTIATRSRPIGFGLTVWTRRVFEEACLVRGQRYDD